jgi:hypothetical protein
MTVNTNHFTGLVGQAALPRSCALLSSVFVVRRLRVMRAIDPRCAGLQQPEAGQQTMVFGDLQAAAGVSPPQQLAALVQTWPDGQDEPASLLQGWRQTVAPGAV